jgi:hypothetical protein
MMWERLRDSKGAIPVFVMMGILVVSSLLSGWLGFKIAGGQPYAILIAAGVGFLVGLTLLPSLARTIRWFKGEIKE